MNYAGLTDLWNCNCYPHLFRCCSTIKITFTFSVLFSTETSLLPYFTLFSSHCSVFKVRSSSFKARLKRLKLNRFNPISKWCVEISGIEPLTSCLQGRRSPSWAKPPYPSITFLEVVGQNGLEPSTSRLSVVCSSQLSYWPVLTSSLRRYIFSIPCKLNNASISEHFYWP